MVECTLNPDFVIRLPDVQYFEYKEYNIWNELIVLANMRLILKLVEITFRAYILLAQNKSCENVNKIVPVDFFDILWFTKKQPHK